MQSCKQTFTHDVRQLICSDCKKASCVNAYWHVTVLNSGPDDYDSGNILSIHYTCSLCSKRWMAGLGLPLNPTQQMIDDVRDNLYKSLIYLNRDKRNLPRYRRLNPNRGEYV